MNTEQDLATKFKEYQELAKTEKNINVEKLMVAALETQNTNLVPAKKKYTAFIISLAFPPFGLFYALKYYFSPEDDAKRVALICFILTSLSILLMWVILNSLLSSTGGSLNQIQQIKPGDIQQLLE